MIASSMRLKFLLVIVVFTTMILAGLGVHRSMQTTDSKTDQAMSAACDRSDELPNDPMRGITVDEAVCSGQVKPAIE